MKILKLKNYFFISNLQEGVISLYNWLEKQILHGPVSRARTRFLKMLVPKMKEIDETRIEMLKKYSDKKKEKDKDGKAVENPIMFYEEVWEEDREKKGEGKWVTSNRSIGELLMENESPNPIKFRTVETTDQNIGKRYKVTEKAKEFDKDYQQFLNEEMVVDVIPSNREDIYLVRDLVLGTKEEFSGRQGILYNEWCEALENIAEDKEEKTETKKKK